MTNSSKRNANLPIKVPARGKTVSVNELAAMWNMRGEAIRKFIAEGMPVWKEGGKGVAHTLATEDCYRWREERAVAQALQRYADQSSDRGPSKPDEGDRLRQIKIEK